MARRSNTGSLPKAKSLRLWVRKPHQPFPPSGREAARSPNDPTCHTEPPLSLSISSPLSGIFAGSWGRQIDDSAPLDHCWLMHSSKKWPRHPLQCRGQVGALGRPALMCGRPRVRRTLIQTHLDLLRSDGQHKFAAKFQCASKRLPEKATAVVAARSLLSQVLATRKTRRR